MNMYDDFDPRQLFDILLGFLMGYTFCAIMFL